MVTLDIAMEKNWPKQLLIFTKWYGQLLMCVGQTNSYCFKSKRFDNMIDCWRWLRNYYGLSWGGNILK